MCVKTDLSAIASHSMISVCVCIQSSCVSLAVGGGVYFAYCVDFLCYQRDAAQFYGRDGYVSRVLEKQHVSVPVCVSEQAENENESKQQCAVKSSTATPSL